MKRVSRTVVVAMVLVAGLSGSAMGVTYEFVESPTQPAEAVVKVYEVWFHAEAGEDNVTALSLDFGQAGGQGVLQTWTPGGSQTLWGMDGSSYPADSGFVLEYADLLEVIAGETNDTCFGDQQGYGSLFGTFGLVPAAQAQSLLAARVAVRPGDAVLMDASVSLGQTGGQSDFLGVALPVTAEGDMNHDGVLDAADIDLISAAVNDGNPLYDVTGDCVTDSADRDYWVETLKGTAYGDANLDRSVDLLDLGVVGDNWKHSVSSWAEGDFNADGVVDLLDLAEVGNNWKYTATGGASAGGSALIPEPATMTLLGLGGLVVLRRQRRVRA